MRSLGAGLRISLAGRLARRSRRPGGTARRRGLEAPGAAGRRTRWPFPARGSSRAIRRSSIGRAGVPVFRRLGAELRFWLSSVIVSARLERQSVIGRAYLTAVIDQHVLQRPVGTPAIMVLEGTNVGLWGAFDIAARHWRISAACWPLRP